MKRILSLILLLLVALAMAACQAEVDLDEPPEIIYGQDVCEECSMIISESRYATSLVTVAGDVRIFDDIGDMLKYDAEQAENVHIYWVHDYVTEEWLNADDAAFVLSDDLVTPMGWGLAAFADSAVAEEFATDLGGVVTDFGTLQEEIGDGSLDIANFTGHHHGDEDTHSPADEDN